MTLAILFAAVLPLHSPSPLDASIEAFSKVNAYTVTLVSSDEEIKYSYKRPGFIRMDFIRPHNGAILSYDPGIKKVKLRPFGFFKSFVLELDPDNRLIKSSAGHTVDKSDIGALLSNAGNLKKRGKETAEGYEVLDGKEAVAIYIEGAPGETVEGIHAYRLWFDTETRLPIKAISYGKGGKRIEEVLLEGLVVNPLIPEDFFDID